MEKPKVDRQVRINPALYAELSAVADFQRRTIKGLTELLIERGLADEKKKNQHVMEEND